MRSDYTLTRFILLSDYGVAPADKTKCAKASAHIDEAIED
jgi:hypothetical protein